MKSRTLFCGLALALLAPALAAAQQVQAGIIGGANFSNLNVVDELNQVLDTDGAREMAIGAIVEIPINDILSVRLAPMWVRGGALILSNDPASVDMDAVFDVLQVPALLTARLPGRVQPFVSAGPTVGYMVNSEIRATSMGLDFAGDATAITRRWALGITAAAGVSTRIGPATVFWEGRYEFGLTDIHRPGNVEFQSGFLTQTVAYPDPAELSTRNFHLLMGAMIPV